MQQFDLCGIRSSGAINLVLILQHDWLAEQRTLVVAPVIEITQYRPISKLHPVFEFEGKRYVVALDLIMTVNRNALGPKMASLTAHRDAIKRGLDTLFDGF